MKISELEPKQGSVNVEVEVISIEEPKVFNKYGREIRVANANVKDDSGEIKLTLWNDDIEKVKPRMKLKIENGYINEFQGEKQLTTGKYGKFEVLGNGEGSGKESSDDSKTSEDNNQETATEDISNSQEGGHKQEEQTQNTPTQQEADESLL